MSSEWNFFFFFKENKLHEICDEYCVIKFKPEKVKEKKKRKGRIKGDYH